MFKKVLPSFVKKLLIAKLVFFKKFLYTVFLKNDYKLLMRLLKIEKYTVVFLDSMMEKCVAKTETTSPVFSPFMNGQDCKRIDVIAPAIKIYFLNNTYVNMESSNFIMSNHVIIERIPSIDLDCCNYATGAVLQHNSKTALCKKMENNLDVIENGVFLGGNGSWNYYHWMIEILPKIELLQQTGIFDCTKNILVSNVVNVINSFKITLLEALRNKDIKCMFLEPNKFYKVKNLYVITTPNNILFNSKGILTSPYYNYFRRESTDYIRDLVFKMITKYNQKRLEDIINLLKNKHGKINIFLARKKGGPRTYNQDEVIRLFHEEFDAKEVNIEDYSIAEQAFIFYNADFIAGPSGAAWTNIIFCKNETLAISWIPKELEYFSVYSTLAKYYGVKLVFVECYSLNKKMLHAPYIVPLDVLKEQRMYIKAEGV
jgi:hypothetical protein